MDSKGIAGHRVRVNMGVKGAEPPEAVAIFKYERSILGCQDFNPATTHRPTFLSSFT